MLVGIVHNTIPTGAYFAYYGLFRHSPYDSVGLI
jgi:hypothetical protein